MPICITCSTPVKHLYTTYSKADDRTLGKGVRLTQCPNCKRFADKYVEHDYVVLFIDLVLIKPQVYRHLLFNRLGRTDDKLDPSILRLGILLVLFDVYITWARIEKSNNHNHNHNRQNEEQRNNTISDAPIITQYLFFLTLNVLATLAQHLTIRLLGKILLTQQPKQIPHRQHQHRHHQQRHSQQHDPKQGKSNMPRNNSPSKQRTRANSHGQGQGQSQGQSILSAASTQPANTATATSPTVDTNSNVDAVHSSPGSAPGIASNSDNTHGNLNPPSNTTAPSNQHDDAQSLSTSSTSPRNHTHHSPLSSSSSSLHPSGPRSAASPAAISTALLVSSCTKLFPILLVIWPTSIAPHANSTFAADDSSSSAGGNGGSNRLLGGGGDGDGNTNGGIGLFAARASSYIGWVVLFNNIEALLILLDCGYVVATTLAVTGMLGRWIVEGWLLAMVGLSRDGHGPVADVVEGLWWMKSYIL